MTLETLWFVLGLLACAGALLTYGYIVRSRAWSGLSGLLALVVIMFAIAVVSYAGFSNGFGV